MADLVRISATDAAGICDISHAIAAAPSITFTVEAASPEFADGAAYGVSGCARDVLTGTVAALGPIDGALGDPGWSTRNAEIVFDLPAAITGAAAVNGVVEVVGVVRVGRAIAGADADMETGMFTWVAQ
jgi:hypothetical protein